MNFFIRAFALSILLASSAHALTETSFVPIATGVFDDPELTGFTTWAYRVDAQDDWNLSRLEVILASGTLNHVAPGLGQETAEPNGLGDSAAFGPTSVLGDLASSRGGVVFANHRETPTYLNSTWYDGERNDVGVFDIAMITLSDNANGTLAYQTVSDSFGYEEDGPSAAYDSPDQLYPDLKIVNGQIVSFDGHIPPLDRPVFEQPKNPHTKVDAYDTNFVLVDSGKFDDPSLPGYTTWAYRVDAPTDWTNADLEINLTSGTLNHVQPEAFGSPNGPNDFGDTAAFAPLNELGDLASGFNGPGQYYGNHVETSTQLKTSWGTINSDDLGTFDVAMITLSGDANGSLNFRSIYGYTVLEGGYTRRNGVRFPATHEIRDGQIVQIREFDSPTDPLPQPPTTPVDPPTTPVDPPTDPPIITPTDPPKRPDPPSGTPGTTTEFVPVQSGKFDEAGLEGFTTFAMRVTATTDWTNADLKVQLTSGTLRQLEGPAPFGGTAKIAGPAGFGDTAVFGPNSSDDDLVSGLLYPQLAVDHVETDTEFAASWFNTSTDDIGTFDIAMITLSDDATGTIVFRTIAGTHVEEGGFTRGASVTFEVRDGQIVGLVSAIPEPSAILLFSLGILPLLVSRKLGCCAGYGR